MCVGPFHNDSMRQSPGMISQEGKTDLGFLHSFMELEEVAKGSVDYGVDLRHGESGLSGQLRDIDEGGPETNERLYCEVSAKGVEYRVLQLEARILSKCTIVDVEQVLGVSVSTKTSLCVTFEEG